MFKDKSRPSGLEFATCSSCNNGTSAADLVACAFSRLGPDGADIDWKIQEFSQWKTTLEQKALGVVNEFFRPEKNKEILRYTKHGLIRPLIHVSADGPLLKSYLDIFSAKLGMALYREHVGQPLPLSGSVFSRWYLSSGLGQKSANIILDELPLANTLQQGRFSVKDQFVYRFNCDEKSIFAALSKFHDGLFIFTIAMAKPEEINLKMSGPTDSFAKPGELISMLPPKGKPYWN